jgi:hypothetical protein
VERCASTCRVGLGGGLTLGRSEPWAVTDRYEAPFEFKGELKEVVVEVGGALIEDKDAETRMVMARQ